MDDFVENFTSYKQWFEFDNPKTINEAVRKERMCYHQFRGKGEISNFW